MFLPLSLPTCSSFQFSYLWLISAAISCFLKRRETSSYNYNFLSAFLPAYPTQDLGGSTIRSSRNQKISPSSFHDLETILCLPANVPGCSDVHPSQSGASAGGGVVTGTHHLIRRAVCSRHREEGPQGAEDDTVPGATHSCPSVA